MLWHINIFSNCSSTEWLQVIYHGIPHSITMAGYYIMLPMLLNIASIWIQGNWYKNFMQWYMGIIAGITMFGIIVDAILYGYWGFRLDSTPLLYLLDSPTQAVGQVPIWQPIITIIFSIIFGIGVYKIIGRFLNNNSHNHKIAETILSVIALPIIFLGIRGGITESTMNVGRVYFSQDKMELNHAATNPIFSFLYSIGKTESFANQYRFMPDNEAQQIISKLHCIESDTTRTSVLRSEKPDILIVMLESFSGLVCEKITPETDSNIMPTINQLADEGIWFANFYANSWRTDRAIVSILSAYPAQPTYSLMKDQNLCNNIPHLSRSLNKAGYDTEFIYGGDINFTNLKGYLTASQVGKIIGMNDFPTNTHTAKWGVPDEITFQYVSTSIKESIAKRKSQQEEPFCKILMTLSSHEPFDVPSKKFRDKFCNSVAYSDSCLNVLIRELKSSKVWDNLLIILLPDHSISNWPEGIGFGELRRYHIPMIWAGGAIKEPTTVTTISSQIDLASTLLSQMNLPHKEFIFSKDIFCAKAPHFAFFDFPDGFGFVTDSCRYIQDNNKDGMPFPDSNDPSGKAQRYGKAFLQSLYDDLSKR